ncbi:outer membrane beta-barrel protein, partial [Chryseobacterium sp. CH1]|uniref:outer membrane beta-barrel protein n=1 Tax=Chryseobacterium sp. CH1 TaxID=713551 RepID=UPI0010269653
ASTFSDSNNEYSDYNEKVKLGSHVGIFVNIPVAEKFSVQPELLFSQMGSKTEEKYTYASTFSDSNNEYSDYNEKVKLGSHVGIFVNIPV